jgi:predicted dehydrogenase
MNSGNESGKIGIGVIGLGRRGISLLETLIGMEDIAIPAVCELYEDRLKAGVDLVETSGRPRPAGYKDYRDLLAHKDIQGVIISSSWTSHVDISIAAMKAGIYPAPEVGGAFSLEECWELVKTSESTGIPCMLLENCCYDRNEMAILHMVKKGIFGELIHAQCGYGHDLREILGTSDRHYRTDHYVYRNGDNYPTHGLGPMAKIFDINRGNRFLTLTSMASKARGLHEWAVSYGKAGHPLAQKTINQGDIVTTMIKCSRGETIVITLDTTLPRPYSRAGRVQGTKGLWMEDNRSIHIEGRSPKHEWESFETYRNEYEHPLWKEFIRLGLRGGHGGMDYLVLRAFVESVANQAPTPIDVYDAATWMAVTTLSEQSIALGSAPVSFPDFTNGKWMLDRPVNKNKYGLEEVNETYY